MAASQPATRAPYLRGLNADEAAAIIKKVQDLQARLRSGEQLHFDLLSGAPASYQETSVSPREVFLRMPFEKTEWVELISNDNKLWQRHRLSIQETPGGLLWDIEVVIGINGQVERVEMFNHPPHPF